MKIKYPTQIKQRRLGDKLFVLEVIRDLDEAIDILCDSMTPEEQKDPFAEDLCPYFGILWEAAEGLAFYLNDHPDVVNGKTVLELGCGLGLPSMVAAHLGGDVLATDFHPDVEEYFARNCRHSVLNCNYQRLNWRDDQAQVGLFDVVMGSDVLYESKHPRDVARGLLRFLKPNGSILLSDPGRAYLQQFLSAMHDEGYREERSSYEVEGKTVFVYLFRQTSDKRELGQIIFMRK